ncbi:outer membrane beta-barrel protein [Pedobacter gandavensis]|uniref:Outer membrane protein beta-barrel domain-containing protein n=1 Tax=Pedobacter gandavensis TaxID=2679963 RepID=A0ABR6EX74_9SPHI|nr:outer membrane beta-barrel protein [Pedobacter gandavensis]MBB2149869.1 hypothetical protein [Pedobacter gandavensis]
MKKGLLIAGLALFGAAAQAQDLKPVAGDVTTEFGLTGGINATNFNLNDNAGMLRFRYFQKENLAFRLGFNVSSNNDKTNVYGTTAPFLGNKGTITETGTNVMINLGVEKHFAGTARLSPYVGADLIFGSRTGKIETENALATGAGKGTYVNDFFSENKLASTTSIGLRGVIGADYYIAKRLFLGAEAGFGFAYEKDGKSEITTTTGGVTTTEKHKSAGSNTTIKPSVITGVRIGFAF